MEIDSLVQGKLNRLKEQLTGMGSVAVAYSGGVDSALLLRVAYDCLGDQAIALTAVSPSLPQAELVDAQAIAQQIGIQHRLIDTHETDDPQYLANTPTRCFFCKNEVYGELVSYAHQQGFTFIIDGTNADDVGDHRPGRRAARDHGVHSPLMDAGLTKSDIRSLARHFGLPNWDKPAAACLSSRIPYGTYITLDMLSQVEQAEAYLKNLGFHQVRVRHHDLIARIEVDLQDLEKMLNRRQEILSALKEIGFTYITLDLAGFRSGSLNEVLVSYGRR
jgi:pyridinium-3,5-biscarboxylic acid mononucleotide sulfurtransferase